MKLLHLLKLRYRTALLTSLFLIPYSLFVIPAAAQPARWTPEQARAWQQQQGFRVGANFLPSSAINQLEMWQSESWDPQTIDKELGWAAAIGMSVMRVYLHDIAWESDPEGFLQRMDQFLGIADKHRIKILFTIFDDCWNPDAKAGKQPAPKPGIHNSGWVRSPNKSLHDNEPGYPKLEAYVKAVLTRFQIDSRIYMWDLYNEPGNSGYGISSMPLLKQVFRWAWSVRPSQPLTVGVWFQQYPELNRFQLDNSDVISFHNYDDTVSLKKALDSLTSFGRPIVCTEYMARTRGSRFETHLPIFQRYGVTAINWGLVAGKSNTIYQWDTPMPDGAEPKLWFHDVFRKNGMAYSETEIAAIRSATSRNAHDTTVYSILIAGQVRGQTRIWTLPDGRFRQTYQYNDRGRGDSMVTDYRLDEEGFITSLQMTGVDYMKSPVFEKFQMGQGKASWENNAEKESTTFEGKAYYSGLKTGAGPFVKTLLRQGNRLNLLPVGKVEAQTVYQGEFSSESGMRKLSLIAITGLSLAPSYVWVDEKNEEFAQVSDWFTSILRGYESIAPKLLEIQQGESVRYYEAISQRLRRQPAGGMVIQNTRLFDAKTGKTLSPVTVWIEGKTIRSVYTGKAPVAPTGWTVVDGNGKTLLPGLWDMHTHMSDNMEAILHLAAGVTSVRDMGNSEDLLKRVADINNGRMIGPQEAVISGFIDGAGPFAAPTGALIQNLEEGLHHIRRYDSLGFKQIKLYSSIKPEWVKPLADEAHRRGMRVCGHIPAYMTATQAIGAGYNEITHMNMLVLNFFGDTIDTRSRGRFTIPAEKAATIDLEGPEFKSFVQLLKTKKIAIDPTITIFEMLFTGREGIPSETYKYMLPAFPAQWQRSLKAGGGGLPVPEGMDERYRASFAAMLRMLKALYDAGITIVPGTDDFAGLTLHRELELYVKAGIPVPAVLQIATIVSATHAGQGDLRGSIEAGKFADMVLYDGDPSRQIGDIRKAVLVIKDGIPYDPAALYAALSIRLENIRTQ